MGKPKLQHSSLLQETLACKIYLINLHIKIRSSPAKQRITGRNIKLKRTSRFLRWTLRMISFAKAI